MSKRIKLIGFNSIRFKVSLLYTAILGVILIFYTAILFFGQRYALYRDLDRELAIKAQEVTNAINSFLPVLENDQRAFYLSANTVIRQEEASYPNQEKIKEVKKRLSFIYEKLDIRNNYIVLATTSGQAIATSKNVDEQLLSYLLKGTSESAQKIVSYHNVNIGNRRLRIITTPYYYKNTRMYLLQVGLSLTPVMKSLYGRMFFAFLTIPLVLFFASFMGGIITQRILKPVMQLTNTAKNITYKDLTSRVKIEHVDEELRYLVDAFNEMISRLEKSFRYIDEFSSNVAHELKTPLTIMIGESELALMQEREIQEYKRVLEVNLREAGHMFKIVEDLLLLSKLEHQPDAFKFEQVDFSLFMTEIFEQAQKLAQPKQIKVELHMPDKHIDIQADWLHLRRLFINLVNNAVKFTPERGKITLEVKLKAKEIAVSISDTGIGIAPEDIGKIFDRFYHIDHAGFVSQGSSGLGLSIVQSIAKIHHATISVKSQPEKGSTFSISLPL